MVYNVLMKKNTNTKIISCLLAAIFATSSASCSSNKKEYVTVKESDPWYECTTVSIDELYPADKYDYVYYDPIGTSDGKIYIMTQAEDFFEYSKNMSYEEYAKHIKQSILEFTFDGELVSETDFSPHCQNGQLRTIQKVWISDGNINILESEYDISAKTTNKYYLNDEPLELPEDAYSYAKTVRLDDIFTNNGYTLFGLYRDDSQTYYIKTPDGDCRQIQLEKASGGIVQFTDHFIPFEGSKVLIPCYLTDSYILLLADIETGNIEEYSGIYGTDAFNAEFVSGRSIARDTEGFKIIDGKQDEQTSLFEYCQIDANMMNIAESELLYVSDDCNDIILACENYGSFSYYGLPSTFTLYHLSKAQVNPNAGKAILTLTCDEDALIDNSDFEAIRRFNKENDSCIIKYEFPFDMQGNPVDVDADITMTSAMTSDPTDKANYIDLAPHLDTNSDEFKEKYFANAFGASMFDGAIYRVPLSISASGIITASSNVPSGQIGFTFDSYTEFVDDICNGSDPMNGSYTYASGKTGYFTDLFIHMSDCFITNGKVDLDRDEFRALIMYVDEHGSEKKTSDEDSTYTNNPVINDLNYKIGLHNSGETIESTNEAKYGIFYSIDEYIDNYDQFGEGLSVYGLPSFDGRGPMALPTKFISVSSSTAYQEACVDFIKLILSDEIQSQMIYNPVNRNALRTLCEKALATYNARVTNGRMSNRPSATVIPDEAVDRYIDILDSSCCSLAVGSAIEDILMEESSSYFSGAKALDDVIPVMQKRIQTVLDENG